MSWNTTAARVIAAAESTIGMGETPPGSNVNAITRAYGDPGGEWCSMAVWYWFRTSSPAHIDLRTALKCTGYASTVLAAQAAQRAGYWHGSDTDIRPGDVVFFRLPGGDPGFVNHTGIVTYVTGQDIATIEGNVTNKVVRGQHGRGAAGFIMGYYRPPYMTPPSTPAPKPSPTPPLFPGAQCFGPGKVNKYVTQLGTALVRKGYGRHYEVGPGPEWTDADRQNCADFQRAQGWTGTDANGIPGPVTWRRLFT